MFMHCKSPENTCVSWNTKNANKKAGNKHKNKKDRTSYLIIHITLNGKTKSYRAHRLAILYTDGYFPLEQVDHIDGNGLNNKRINLREVSDGENKKNKPMYSNNTSGTVGVNWHKAAQKWQVSIRVNGKKIHGFNN